MFKSKREDEEDDDYPAIVVLHLAGAIQDGSAASAGSIVSEPSVKEIDALGAVNLAALEELGDAAHVLVEFTPSQRYPPARNCRFISTRQCQVIQ